MTILMNPPYGRASLHKRIFTTACKYGTVFSLQPHGSIKTHKGFTVKLLPLHTSVKKFGIALMALEIATNVEEKSVVDLSKCKFTTIADGKKNGTLPLKVGGFRSGTGPGTGNGVVFHQPEQLKVGTGVIGSGDKVCNTENLRQPLKMSSYIEGGTNVKSVDTKQNITEENHKNCLYFNSKKERTNFIKNISKLISLQILFSSTIFPQDRDRLLPPLDREYSKDELLDYFGFPKDVYKEFDDIEKEEPDSHYISYERWRDWRKEKYNLDWEEE